mgnify:CR=1 FL=1|tara:strand:+ start:1844 stop:2137 length:294 start_codon:yes stop_codon:yes gene_type:complete
MSADRKHVYHGSEWPEYEDVLVGNREGLETLRAAIDEALEKGESRAHMGEFLGVRCIETAFFEKQRKGNSLGAKIAFSLIGCAAFATVVVVWLALSS